jgi:hypothetical protein
MGWLVDEVPHITHDYMSLVNGLGKSVTVLSNNKLDGNGSSAGHYHYMSSRRYNNIMSR